MQQNKQYVCLSHKIDLDMVEHDSIIFSTDRYDDAFQRSVMRTEFASLVVFCSISINSFAGKFFEFSGDDKTSGLVDLSRGEKMLVGEDLPTMLEVDKMLGEDPRKLSGEMFGEDAVAGKLFEFCEGEMTNTVDGDPAKLPIEQPLIND